METLAIVTALATTVLVPAYLVYMTLRTIGRERRRSGVTRIWANFGLSIVLCALFFLTWIAHGVVEWQEYVEQQHAHGEPTPLSGFVVGFGQSTLENWQSEFLQLFSFVVLAAALIHRGSAESRDSEDRIEQMLKEIKQKLDA